MKGTLYFAAFIKAPFEDGRGGIECPRVSYSRLPVSTLDASTPSISWPRAKGPWGKIVAVGVYDSPVNGNLLIWYPLADPRVIDKGDSLTMSRQSVSSDIQAMARGLDTAGVRTIRKPNPDLADVDPTFRCVMKKPTRKTRLTSIDYEYGSGTAVTLPSRSVFVFDSGEVWAVNAKGNKIIPLARLVARAKKKKNVVVSNFSL